MRSLHLALIFMTTLPMPAIKNWQEEDMATSTRAYPFVGLIVGLFLLLAYWLTQSFTDFIQAVLLLGLGLVITGALHFDGFCDIADAVFASKSPRERQDIAKDTNIGAFALAAGSSLLMLKVAAIIALSDGVYLLIAALLSRTLVLIVISQFKLTNSSQLGRSAKLGFRALAFSLTIGLALSSLIIIFRDARALLILPSTYIFISFVAYFINKRMDGLNGDAYGATIELSEVFILLIASLI